MATSLTGSDKSKNVILYVDDESNNLIGFKSIFRRHFKIYTATSGAEGLEILAKHPVQLVISDQRMPKMTGTQFLKQVADNYPDVMRIILTGYSDYEATLAAINEGKVHKYLMKPWDTEILKDVIDDALSIYGLRQENKELLHNLQKINTELDRFVYSASHDLRAPIASLIGLMNLAKGTDDAHEIKELLKLGEKVLAQLDIFIKEIADYSRNTKANIEIEPIELQGFFQDILDHYKFYDDSMQIEKTIEVEENLKITSDKSRLRAILNNLVSNAIRYSDLDKPTPFLKLSAKTSENEIIIKVADNGRGILAEHLNKIYDMFYRATDSKTGSGLGLFIVKETVEKLGGKISVESHYATGTTFTLCFPQTPAPIAE